MYSARCSPNLKYVTVTTTHSSSVGGGHFAVDVECALPAELLVFGYEYLVAGLCGYGLSQLCVLSGLQQVLVW